MYNINSSAFHPKTHKKKTKTRSSSTSNRKQPFSNQNINLQREFYEWNNSFERLVNMMSIVVQKPTIPLDTSSNKRLFLEEMCSEVCKKANYSSPKKNNGLLNKIKRYQSIIKKLSNKVRELENENQALQLKNKEQLLLQKSQVDNSVLEEKIDRVEELLVEHIQKKPKSTKAKPKERSFFRSSLFENDNTEIQPQDAFLSTSFSIQDDFDPNTTKAISKYRQRVRKQEAMKGKVKNVFPFQVTTRYPTPEDPMSQEYIFDTLQKLPYAKKNQNYSTYISQNSPKKS